MAALEAFTSERPRLFGIAYRMLGTVADADDICQEAYLRWSDADHDSIQTPAAWLTTVTTRLAIDRLRSAQHRRETYVGPWLPEPIAADDPAHDVEIAESATVGFLAVLERLNPIERAVFLLGDIFRYPFAEVATIVGRTEENCRQIARRARGRVQAERPRFEPESDHQEELVAAFAAAVMEGDIDKLEAMLSDDAVHYSDGGASRRAARNPVLGPARIARLYANLAKRVPSGADFRFVRANGQPAAYICDGDRPLGLHIIGIVDGKVNRLYSIVNPDKLTAFHAATVRAYGS